MEVGRGPEKCEIVEICFSVRGAEERRHAAVMDLQSPTLVSAGSPPSGASFFFFSTPPSHLTAF